MSRPFLSKSKYLAGIQCPKLLWFHYNAKEQIPEADAATQARFDQGHEVGELAKRLYPDGLQVTWDQPYAGVISQTQQLLKARKPLFEAGFLAQNLYARADVLVPAPRATWDIVEVKMGTAVKEINLHDLAFQKRCYEAAGLPIRRCCLMHINGEYVRQGAIEPKHLFTVEDVTNETAAAAGNVDKRAADMLATIRLRQAPRQDIGPHCNDPYGCPLQALCWAHVWKHENHVFTLPNARGRDWKLYKQGVLTTDQIPAQFSLATKQELMLAAERSGRPHIDRATLKEFLDSLVYPLLYLDFETFGLSMPIPVLQETRPYQQVPFQYSLHIQSAPKAVPAHHSWIWDGQGDPRAELLRRLSELLGRKGSILAYNMTFEQGRLRECVERFPAHAKWLAAVEQRLVDLYAPFRNFAIYHPDQHGSASIKAVLPALTGKGYTRLAIQDGGQASEEFVRVTFGKVSAAERRRVCQDLEAYCGLDTMGMVRIIEVLSGMR